MRNVDIRVAAVAQPRVRRAVICHDHDVIKVFDEVQTNIYIILLLLPRQMPGQLYSNKE